MNQLLELANAFFNEPEKSNSLDLLKFLARKKAEITAEDAMEMGFDVETLERMAHYGLISVKSPESYSSTKLIPVKNPKYYMGLMEDTIIAPTDYSFSAEFIKSLPIIKPGKALEVILRQCAFYYSGDSFHYGITGKDYGDEGNLPGTKTLGYFVEFDSRLSQTVEETKFYIPSLVLTRAKDCADRREAGRYSVDFRCIHSVRILK